MSRQVHEYPGYSQGAPSASVKRRRTGDYSDAAKSCLTHDDYTVGWICAIPTEQVAAQVFLDERHQGPNYKSRNDNNDYILGGIGRHNVVIAVLPDGEYGISSAATVARDLLHSFPNIRIGLMVGIGGGAPSPKHDIRLGDVVVSVPRDGESGVYQYDFGKTIQNQSFQPSGFLYPPPKYLLTAVNGLKCDYEVDGHCFEETINKILEKKPRLRAKYRRPDSNRDRLYRSEFIHRDGKSNCHEACGVDSSNLISRQERTEDEDNPAIHYGFVASANQLMKDAVIRDRLTAEKDVLCFEMEAAGLMNHFPCLVIRGICDYSDSHKNKEWQGYAAMAAAAYARDLLYRIPPEQVEAEKLAGSLINSFAISSVGHSNTDTPHSSARSGDSEETERQESQVLDNKRKRELIDSLRFDQIDARRWTIKRAHYKTCKWLLKEPKYLDWLDSNKLGEHHGFLWIKGKPGTGKSTLMNFILHNAQRGMKDKIIISFFFNARGDDLEKSTIGMYRSILFQLLQRVPVLQDVFDSLGLASWSGNHYEWNVESLTALLEHTLLNLTGFSFAFFIDALDECDERQIRDMVSFLEHLGELTASAGVEFRVCFSSRHYPHITLTKGLDLALEGQEGHDQDITCYLDTELKIGRGKVADQIRVDLQEKASGIFLWVILVVEILNKEYDNGRTHKLQQKLKDIPGGLHELFRDLLTRDYAYRGELLLCIQWVLLARQPLTPEQLYFAIHSGVNLEAPTRWDRSDLKESTIRRFIVSSSKGLAEITKSKKPKVQFIHESVKDFLLKEDGLNEIWSDIGRNFQAESHERLKQCCLSYLRIDIYAELNIYNHLPTANSAEAAELRELADKEYPFLEYATRNLLYHADAAEGGGVKQSDFLESFQLARWLELDNLFQRHELRRHTSNVSLLYLLAEYNLGNLIAVHPSKLSCFEVEDERYGTPIFAALATHSVEAVRNFVRVLAEVKPPILIPYDIRQEYYHNGEAWFTLGRHFKFSRSRSVFFQLAEKCNNAMLIAFLLVSSKFDVNLPDENGFLPLSKAAEIGNEAAVKLLLERGAQSDSPCGSHGSPLSLAAEKGHDAIVKVLIEEGVNIESAHDFEASPLALASKEGRNSTVKLLLDEGANVNAIDDLGRSPLVQAAKGGHEEVVKLLVEKGANVNVGRLGDFPLALAVENDHVAVAMLLVEKGADVNVRGNLGRTPLLWAIEKGNEAVAKLLVEKGADVNVIGRSGWAPLLWASEENYEATVNSLFDTAAEVWWRDRDSTPLASAARMGQELVVELLLERGADIESRSDVHMTPLALAAEKGHEAVVKLLVEKGADMESKTAFNLRPLALATMNGHEAVVRLLVEKGADTESKNTVGMTPLATAACNGHEEVVKLLVKNGAHIESRDNQGRTPLDRAARNWHFDIVQFMLENGADIEIGSKINSELLLSAARRGNEAVVRLLVERGVDIESREYDDRTPLALAAEEGHEAVAKLLVGRGAAIDSRDHYRRTPLGLAAIGGHEAIVRILLEKGADIESRTCDDKTPLALAAEEGHKAVAELLVEKGADLESKDRLGKTPLELADENRHRHIATMLRQKL